jgi:hypothetical protein
LNTPERWQSPPFDQLADYAALFEWPWDAALAELNGLAVTHLPGGLRFAEQDVALASDGMSYEQRIGERGLIAMRRDSLHDLYGALMWLQWPLSKWAIHQGQWAGILALGPKQRTRHQQALTHIDEAGTVVLTEDRSLIKALQAHDWSGLLRDRREDWSRAQTWVIGHALFELRQTRPHDLQASKVIAVLASDSSWRGLSREQSRTLLDGCIAEGIAGGRVAADPKDQSTLPLAAIPSWEPRSADPAFIASAPCFRPKPAGRVYAGPLRL